jgi:hypothetical protein
MRRSFLAFCVLIVHTLNAQDVPNEEDWSEMPVPVTPVDVYGAPSDADILFNGTNLDAWCAEDGDASGWSVDKGVLKIVPGTGNIYTKKGYADVQLHIEWMVPAGASGNGNSGIYLQGRYEVQIFRSHNNQVPIYYNGQAGSIYKQFKPLVNACLPPGNWEAYDIVFYAPRFDRDSALLEPARVTVMHNGVLIQHNAVLRGSTTHAKATGYEVHNNKEPLMIQDHGDEVWFRNIWIREL